MSGEFSNATQNIEGIKKKLLHCHHFTLFIMKRFHIFVSSFLIILLLGSASEGVFSSANFFKASVTLAAKNSVKTKKAKKVKKVKKAKKEKKQNIASPAQTEVEKALKEELPQMRDEIRRLAKEELQIELPERVPERATYEGIEGDYHDIVANMDRVEKSYKEGDYEKALKFVNKIKRDYDETLVNIPGYKEEQARVAGEQAASKAEEEASAAFEKEQEEGYKAVRKELADAKALEEKTNKEAKACVDKYLKFTPPAKYVMNFMATEFSLCPSLTLNPPTNYTFYPDESGKSGTTVFDGGPQITVEFAVPKQDLLNGAFAMEKKREGAILKPINGSPWYYMKLTGETTFITAGESYEAYVDLTQIRFTILLDTSNPGKDPKAVQKTTSDFEKMIKTLSIRTDVPSKIEPAVTVTKEMLALSGTWKQIKSFSKEDLDAGFDQNPKAGTPVKAHLIAFRTNKICYFIQEEKPSTCYSGYVKYTLTGDTINYNDGNDRQWKILKNTASELELVDQKGNKNIFQKTATEGPPEQ